MNKALFLLASLVLSVDLASAAAFDCAKAATHVEKAICANPELSQLDIHLHSYYLSAMYELEESKACLKTDQLQWLKTVRNVCKDNACLKTAYLNRLSELDLFPLGASRIKYMNCL